MGRRTLLTPETTQKLVHGIEQGLRTWVHICAYAGLSTGTLRDWRERAEAGDEDAQALFAELEAAQARRAAKYLQKMRQTGKDDWRMWRELLAMVEPEAYGRQPQDVKVAATVETRGNVTYGVDGVMAETIFEILAAVGALQGEGDDELSAREL